jgi:hypothetical protein
MLAREEGGTWRQARSWWWFEVKGKAEGRVGRGREPVGRSPARAAVKGGLLTAGMADDGWWYLPSQEVDLELPRIRSKPLAANCEDTRQFCRR